MRREPWICCILATSLGCHARERYESSPTSTAAVTPSGEAAAPSSLPVPSATIPVHALGEVAELPLYRVKLVAERDCGSPTSAAQGRPLRSFGVELEVTNLSTDVLATNPFYATLVDNERYTYTTSLSGCTPQLPARFLNPQETVRGWVPFELPRNVVTVHLDYRPVIAGDAPQIARFRIKP